jgi:CheY-like chemotaxis protein
MNGDMPGAAAPEPHAMSLRSVAAVGITAAPGAASASARPVRPAVLIVDRHADSAAMLAWWLTSCGFDCRVEPDPEAAEAAVRSQRPAVVVLEPWTPGTAIEEMAGRVRRMAAVLPVVLVSVLDPAVSGAMAGGPASSGGPGGPGVAAVLHKPVGLLETAEAVGAALRATARPASHPEAA